MDTVLAIVATKAVIASLLAVVVALAAHIVKRPAVVHALWLLVLLELLAPPLLRVPIVSVDHVTRWTGPATGRVTSLLASLSGMLPSLDFSRSRKTDHQSHDVVLEDLVHPTQAPSEAPHVDVQRQRGDSSGRAVSPSRVPAAGVNGSRPTDPAGTTQPAGPTAPEGSTERLAAMPAVTLPDPSMADPDHPYGTAPAFGMDPRSASAVSSPPTDTSEVPIPSGDPHDGLRMIVFAWAAGAAMVLLLAVQRSTRFRRLVREAPGDPRELQARAAHLASRMGLRRCPQVRVVEGRISPMVWFRRGKIELLFPADLIVRLNEPERDALLAHELAHVRRRDPWVRYVELAASSAFWWHPVAWWARLCLRRAEERACDARVVWALPGHTRAYALAIIETAEFLAGPRVPTPSIASGFDEFHNLKERLTMMLERPRPTLLSRPQQSVLAVIALALVLVFPSWAERSGKGAREGPADPTAESRAQEEAASELEAAAADQARAALEDSAAALEGAKGIDVHRMDAWRALQDQAAALESQLRHVRMRQTALATALERDRAPAKTDEGGTEAGAGQDLADTSADWNAADERTEMDAEAATAADDAARRSAGIDPETAAAAGDKVRRQIAQKVEAATREESRRRIAQEVDAATQEETRRRLAQELEAAKSEESRRRIEQEIEAAAAAEEARQHSVGSSVDERAAAEAEARGRIAQEVEAATQEETRRGIAQELEAAAASEDRARGRAGHDLQRAPAAEDEADDPEPQDPDEIEQDRDESRRLDEEALRERTLVQRESRSDQAPSGRRSRESTMSELGYELGQIESRIRALVERGETARVAALQDRARELTRSIQSRVARSARRAAMTARRESVRARRLARIEIARSMARLDTQQKTLERAIRTLETELRDLDPARGGAVSGALQGSIEQLRRALEARGPSLSRDARRMARSQTALERDAAMAKRALEGKLRSLRGPKGSDRLRQLRQRLEELDRSREKTPRKYE